MKNSLMIFLLLACGLCFGQNLVPNPSFEDTVSCPFFYSNITDCQQWNSYSIYGTPDYYNTCATAWVTVPNSYYGYQVPYQGNAYAGIFTFSYGQDSYRESIGAQLTSPLQVGVKYYVSFYASRAEKSSGNFTYATNKMGAKFGTYPLKSADPVNNFAHIYSNTIITDTINWVLVAGSFIADSNYTYIGIGNFFDDAHTDTLNLGTRWQAYYFIDNICVSADSLACGVATALKPLKQNVDVTLSPNPFSTRLTFTFSDNEPTTVSLYNFLGQQVLQQTFTNSTTVNTAQLADGIYFYELRSNKGTLKTGKLVKQ